MHHKSKLILLSIKDLKIFFYFFVYNIEIRGEHQFFVNFKKVIRICKFFSRCDKFLGSFKAQFANYRKLYTKYYLKVYSIRWNVTYRYSLIYFTDRFVAKS